VQFGSFLGSLSYLTFVEKAILEIQKSLFRFL
jgi:hypothetical protein